MDDVYERLVREIMLWLPEPIRSLVGKLGRAAVVELEEIRLRVGRPLALEAGGRSLFLTPEAGLTEDKGKGYKVSSQDLARLLQLVSQASLYALEEELRQGYITLPGGYRVGLGGEAVVEGGRIRHLKHISSASIRLSRQVPGCADAVMPFVLRNHGGHPYRTLIVSPPRCGKTTLLRDMVRQLSDGVRGSGFPGVNVVLVDERSEVAGCYHGMPQNDVGARTDVLDGCPKGEGMLMAIRALSPAVVATDEIGTPVELAAVQEMLNAGVAVVTTVHAADLGELSRRTAWAAVLEQQVFERFIIMGRSCGSGTIEKILAADGRTVLLGRPLRASAGAGGLGGGGEAGVVAENGRSANGGPGLRVHRPGSGPELCLAAPAVARPAGGLANA